MYSFAKAFTVIEFKKKKKALSWLVAALVVEW